MGELNQGSKLLNEIISKSKDTDLIDQVQFLKNRFLEKLCFNSKPRPAGKLVWIHACSVGEVRSSYNIIKSFIKDAKK